jgi:hypothetical protein
MQLCLLSNIVLLFENAAKLRRVLQNSRHDGERAIQRAVMSIRTAYRDATRAEVIYVKGANRRSASSENYGTPTAL